MVTKAVSAAIWLNQIANWDGESQDIQQVLKGAFDAGDYLACIKDLRAKGIEPLLYINGLDRVINALPADSQIQRRCVRALRKTCGIHGTLPDSYLISFPLSKLGQRPSAPGGSSDVWRFPDPQNTQVAFAVKKLRVYENSPIEKMKKKYCKEVIICKRVDHQNVLSIIGVAPTLTEFCMVAPWMKNGHVLSFITKYPGANRLHLLLGVTRGLGYLHYKEVVHGDLKSSNILVDDEGIPRLSDYGLSSITKNINSVNASTPSNGGTVRYRAPELLKNTGKPKPTNKSDVYSLSMVIVELATGEVPFPDLEDPSVIIAIAGGERPKRPRDLGTTGITSPVWKVAKKCWSERAKERPEAKEVLQNLEEIAERVNEELRPPSSSKWWHLGPFK